MANHKDTPQLVRSSVLLKAETDSALRDLADKAERPLSWEIRRALEAHVEAHAEPEPTGAVA